MTIDEKISRLRERFPDNVPITVASEMLGKTPTYVRESLKDGSYSFGNANLGDGGRWSYSIPTERFISYLKGADIIEITQESLLGLMQEGFEKWYAAKIAEAN